MDRKTEGYFHLQTLQNIVVNLSKTTILEIVELDAVSEIMDVITRLIKLWQHDLYQNEENIETDPDTNHRILGNMTLIFSYLQVIEGNPLVADDMNWQYFRETLTELNAIILEFEILAKT